jgi:hypothetical protein
MSEAVNEVFFYKAIKANHLKIVNLYLEKNKVDPSSNQFYALLLSFSHGTNEMKKLLWNFKGLKESLKNEDFTLYNNLLKKYTQIKIGNF